MWGSLEASGESRADVVAKITADSSYTDHGEKLWLCPVSLTAINAGVCLCDASAERGHGAGCPAGHDPDCAAECWADNGEAPPGCDRTVLNLADLPLVPIRVGDRLGWAAVEWHSHNPGPGGGADIPESRLDESDVGHACGGYPCAGVIGGADLLAVADARHELMSDDDWTTATDQWDRANALIVDRINDLLDEVPPVDYPEQASPSLEMA